MSKSPAWAIEARKALLDRGMKITDLANELGYARPYLNNVLLGSVSSPPLQKLICEYLGIKCKAAS